jgi:hypothetical protein
VWRCELQDKTKIEKPLLYLGEKENILLRIKWRWNKVKGMVVVRE